MKKISLFFFFSFFILPAALFATHNRAGEITYEQIGPLTFKVKVLTYTKESSSADRPELEVFWGDGKSDSLPRINGGGNGVSIEIGRAHV